MQTKTYRAPNMLAALQEIQRDLGPNAIVLSMREVSTGPAWQIWSKPGVEVVASTELSPHRKDAKKADEKSPEESIPGRKDIEDILSAISGKKNFQSIEPERINQFQPNSSQRAHLGTVKEPARWSPPNLNPRTMGQNNNKPGNTVINVLGDLVDEILEEARPADKSTVLEETMPPLLKLIQHRLLRQGLDKGLVSHLVETNMRTLSPTVLADEARLTRYMKKQLEASLRPQKNSMAVLQSRIMCLVGATGSGKTSTCAKLAAYYSRTLEKKVVWICADTIRAGAISETRLYAEALEIPYFLAYTPQELGEIVNSQVDADLILIDTPGVNTLDEDKVVELGSFLNEVPSRSIHVTASATTKGTDLIQTVSTFSLFKIKGLIATKMDETSSYGEIYNVMLTTHLPVLFFTNGTQIIGKLHQGEPGKLIDAIFGEGM